MKNNINSALLIGLLGFSVDTLASYTPVASWSFNNTLAADQSGVSALTAIDPLGQSGFITDNVFGVAQTVYRFAGNQTPTNQAGLSFSTTSLLTHGNAYSVDLVFQFEANQSSWKNIFGVSNRSSDNAFYVAPNNHLQVWPQATGTSLFTFGEYHRATLTNNGSGHVSSYLDGVLQFDLTSNSMDFNIYSAANPNNIMTFFADNLIGGGQGEFSNGRVSFIRLFDGELTSQQVATLPSTSAVPLPSALPLILSGLSFLGFASHKRQRKSCNL